MKPSDAKDGVALMASYHSQMASAVNSFNTGDIRSMTSFAVKGVSAQYINAGKESAMAVKAMLYELQHGLPPCSVLLGARKCTVCVMLGKKNGRAIQGCMLCDSCTRTDEGEAILAMPFEGQYEQFLGLPVEKRYNHIRQV